MLVPTDHILQEARRRGYAVGAFNVYTLEGIRAVVSAAESSLSPAILQVLPAALDVGGTPLIAAGLEAARHSAVPMSVHLDHCDVPLTIEIALKAGVSSVMADGSALALEDNLVFTSRMVRLAASMGRTVEAELGRLTGDEDGITVDKRNASLTDPVQAADFVSATGVHALAVCIGNVHGTYHEPPQLDFDRLSAIAENVSIPLVLHGTSGLPDAMIARAVALGVSKFNVNTELRTACLKAGRAYLTGSDKPELAERMRIEISAMVQPVRVKIACFGSEGKAA
jgi:tagatose 1,6-diphosphate aldolase GatY/KbaY